MSNLVNVDFVTKVVEIEVNDNETESLAAMAAINAAQRADEAKELVVDHVDATLAAIDAKTAEEEAELDDYTEIKKADIDDYVDSYVDSTLQPIADAASASAQSAQTTAQALTNYLETKETLTAPAIDTTLSISGAGADARVIGRLESNDSAKIQNIFRLLYSRDGNICDRNELTISGLFSNANGSITSSENFRCGYVPLLGADTYYFYFPVSIFGTGRNKVALFRYDKSYYKSVSTTVIDNNYVSAVISEQDYQNAVYVGMSYRTTVPRPIIIKGEGRELPLSYDFPCWKLKNDKAISWRGDITLSSNGITRIASITDSGFYCLHGLNSAEDLPQGYNTSNGLLRVFNPGLNTTYAVQILIEGTSTLQTYMRYVNTSDTSDTSKWNRLIDKAYVDNVTKGINILNGKVLVCDGDSIAEGVTDLPKNLHAWYGRLTSGYGMTGQNYAAGGGTITYGLYFDGGAMRHSVANNIDTIYSDHPTLDYLILDGGTNDADLIGAFSGDTPPEGFGTWTADDFSGSYDKETFCGAVEYMFYHASSYYPHSKIGFIIPMEMGTNIASLNNRRRYFDEIIKIAEKWHIPVLDLWKNSCADARLTAYYDSSLTPGQNVDAHKFYYDGQHPSSYGYDRMQNMIEAWMQTL